MSTLMQASHQWMTRPADQRFLSLPEMHAKSLAIRQHSVAKVLGNRALQAVPYSESDFRALAVTGPNGAPVLPTNWAFGQLAAKAGAPAAYLRDLPAPIAADCLNYSLQTSSHEELGVLLTKMPGEEPSMTAITGPNYGRIWNEQIIAALMNRFGDGVTGHFRVPGEFGQRVEVTRENTTLYCSDRDMFVFLADEENRIEVPNRRDGQTGSLARGFFVWNSEHGSASLGIATFLFDYACKNRTVWGAEEFREIKIRHTSGAPDRWVQEVAPAIEAYAESSTHSITAAIEAARAVTLAKSLETRDDDVREFLAKRFTRSKAAAMMATHIQDEGRPVETLWDAANAITGYARGVAYQDERVKLEREAGELLRSAA